MGFRNFISQTTIIETYTTITKPYLLKQEINIIFLSTYQIISKKKNLLYLNQKFKELLRLHNRNIILFISEKAPDQLNYFTKESNQTYLQSSSNKIIKHQ